MTYIFRGRPTQENVHKSAQNSWKRICSCLQIITFSSFLQCSGNLLKVVLTSMAILQTGNAKRYVRILLMPPMSQNVNRYKLKKIKTRHQIVAQREITEAITTLHFLFTSQNSGYDYLRFLLPFYNTTTCTLKVKYYHCDKRDLNLFH